MNTNAFVFLNPDGTQDFGLLAIVASTTGIIYAHQCGGYNNELRKLEGFAVPLGIYAENKLVNFFRKKYRGYPPTEMSVTDLEELAHIVSQIPFWKTSEHDSSEDKSKYIELDVNRSHELTEGWLPIRTIYGLGVLLFKNSD
jgi:hypothetical protein